MSNHNDSSSPKLYCIKDIINNAKYTIPMYQRNYAWEDKEILQLIDDVLDYQKKSENNENYYIGSLILYYQQDKGFYEVIDGQQRLTTLTILT